MKYNENMDSMKVGDRIKQRRLRLGLTLEELANKVGISRSTMSRYETGIIEFIPQQNIDSIAAALGTTGAALYGYIDDLSAERSSVFRDRLNDLIEVSDKTDMIAAFGTANPYKDILDGTLPITLDKASEIADAFGVPLDYLIGISSLDIDKIQRRAEYLRGERDKQKATHTEPPASEINSAIDAALMHHVETVKSMCVRADIRPDAIPDRINAATEYLKHGQWFIDGTGGGQID